MKQIRKLLPITMILALFCGTDSVPSINSVVGEREVTKVSSLN